MKNANYEKLKEFFLENEETFNDAIEELDSWNGYLGDDRWYRMSELDDICYGMTISEFIAHIEDRFNFTDGWFQFTFYGITSGSRNYLLWLDMYFADELLENWHNLYLDTDLEELLEEIEKDEEEGEEK